MSFLEAKWNGDGVGTSDKAMCLQNAKGRNSQKSVMGPLALRRRPKSRSQLSGPKVQVEPAFRSQGPSGTGFQVPRSKENGSVLFKNFL